MSVEPQSMSPRARGILGVGLVLWSTVAVGISPSLSKLALDSGSNTLTVIALRSLFMIVAVAVVLKAMGVSFAVERPVFRICLGTGVVFAVMSYGFLGSVEFIPVGLAILIFFLHPMLVAIAEPLLRRQRPTRQHIVWGLVILAGLGLTLGFDLVGLDWRGIALALLGAVACAAMIIGNATAMRRAGTMLVNFYMVATSTVIVAVLLAATGATALPGTGVGWVGILGTGAGFTVGLLCFFAAIPLIGAVRATMISSIEPVLGILFAMAIFGEQMVLLQWFGVALVVGGLVGMEAPIRWNRAAQRA